MIYVWICDGDWVDGNRSYWSEQIYLWAESDKAIKQFNDNEISESSKQEIKEEWTVMKNDIIIGIDHGWSMKKTVTQVFVTGVKEITTTPSVFGDILEYEASITRLEQ